MSAPTPTRIFPVRITNAIGRGLATVGIEVPSPNPEVIRLGQLLEVDEFQRASSLITLSLGVDIRGRSRTLRVNYRTSHQIRTQADRLLEGV